MLITLPAGVFTAIVSGVNDTTGEALVEVYEIEGVWAEVFTPTCIGSGSRPSKSFS